MCPNARAKAEQSKSKIQTPKRLDDREVYPCSSTACGFVDDADEPKGWDAINYHTAYRAWLGYNYGSYRVGPEALANHALVEDCVGYPPTLIVTDEFDPDRDYSREFSGKLYAAHTFCEFHCYGGIGHGQGIPCSDIGDLVHDTTKAGVENLWKYDLSRPWVVEDYKARFERKFANR